jgi:hypothetical protein
LQNLIICGTSIGLSSYKTVSLNECNFINRAVLETEPTDTSFTSDHNLRDFWWLIWNHTWMSSKFHISEYYFLWCHILSSTDPTVHNFFNKFRHERFLRIACGIVKILHSLIILHNYLQPQIPFKKLQSNSETIKFYLLNYKADIYFSVQYYIKMKSFNHMNVTVLTGATGRYRQHESCSKAPEPAALFGWSWKTKAYFITLTKFGNSYECMSHGNKVKGLAKSSTTGVQFTRGIHSSPLHLELLLQSNHFSIQCLLWYLPWEKSGCPFTSI